MRIIAVANHKGGCGKTTTSIHFASCLAHMGKRVLLVDMDPQGHSTCGLGVSIQDCAYTLYDLLRAPHPDMIPTPLLLHKVNPHLYVLPSYSILAAIEEELVQVEGREERLQWRLYQVLEHAEPFDYVILDCPPNLGLLTYNALYAADELIIPIEPSFFSLHGLGKMMETLKAVEQKMLSNVVVHALLTIFDSTLSFSEEIYSEVKEHFQQKLFKSIIHNHVAFKEAAAAGQSIVDYQPEGKAFQDYYNLAIEYLERDWERLHPQREMGWENTLYHRFGPRRVSGGILFQVFNEKARWVEVAGDFNQWIPEPLIKREEDGLWQRIIPLNGGKYRYKYIIDGEWQVDPYQPEEINDFGVTDSCLEVR